MPSASILLAAFLVCSALMVLSRWLLARDDRYQGVFSRAAGKVALGLPAIAGGEVTAAGADELRAIGAAYARYYRGIKRVIEEFQLAGSLVVRGRDGEHVVHRPRNILRCEVVLGESLAGAGLPPGTALYWLPLPGEQVGRVLGRIQTAPLAHVQIGPLSVDVHPDGLDVEDQRLGSIPCVRIAKGTPILLSLDETSEEAIQSVLGDSAPPRGELKKVRLFGGFERVDGRWMIVPLRQEPGDPSAVRGLALHPVSSLLGVVVAESRDKAFPWQAPAVAKAPRELAAA